MTVEPTEEPLTLSEFKNRLRVLTCDFDHELNDLLITARRQVEYDSHRYLVTQTVELYLDRFPCGDTIEIRKLPVSSLTSVQYVDEDRATQTQAASTYDTDLDGEPARIVLRETEDWEDTEPQYPKAVTVTFVAGYGAASAVPVEAKLAIVEYAKMHRSGCNGSQFTYDNLINKLAWSGVWKPV